MSLRPGAQALALGAAAAILSACAETPRPLTPVPPWRPQPAPPTSQRPSPPAGHTIVPPPAREVPATLSPAELPGWAQEDHLQALRAYQAGCRAAEASPERRVCAAARALQIADGAQARAFFEQNFTVQPVGGQGLMTGYFAPEYEARELPDEIFSAGVRPRPPDLKRGADGRFEPYLERAEIEAQPGQALAFMRPEDLFFMQIQGSGYLQFPDGHRMRAAYAADNGRPFVGIARTLIGTGALPPAATTGDRIRAWLAEHRGSEAQAVTDTNPRYVFFTLSPDDSGQPSGAAGTPLTPGRAAAVDPSYHAWGELLWLDADPGGLTGGGRPYRRLAVALDRGSAIQGPARVDLYLGRGEAAGTEAGRIKHPLKLYRLVPRP